MKAYTLAALLFTLTLSLSLVHAENPKHRGEKGDILTPLAMGNTWVYTGNDNMITTDRIEGVVL